MQALTKEEYDFVLSILTPYRIKKLLTEFHTFITERIEEMPYLDLNPKEAFNLLAQDADLLNKTTAILEKLEDVKMVRE